jgi:hemin uptake protein HemP
MEQSTRPPTTLPPEPRKVSSEELLRGDKVVIILHANQAYRLIATKNGKLILQK